MSRAEDGLAGAGGDKVESVWANMRIQRGRRPEGFWKAQAGEDQRLRRGSKKRRRKREECKFRANKLKCDLRSVKPKTGLSWKPRVGGAKEQSISE